MKVVVDENMPGLEQLADVARVEPLPGRSIERQDLLDAKALLVRSVTTVNEQLLSGTPVGFVGSATIGMDHVDQTWLQQQGIHFAHAPGCNAMAVAEYVLQSVLAWFEECKAQNNEQGCQGRTVGVIGYGQVGTRVARLLSALGMAVRVVDPLLPHSAFEGVDPVCLEEALAADVISLHVPLTQSGSCPTRHLLSASRLSQLKQHQLLINTSRGAVVDNEALCQRLQHPEPPTVIMDVWENEPMISTVLFQQVWRGTPHIAGYSRQGKLRGSQQVVQALCRWAGLDDASEALPVNQGRVSMDINSEADLLQLLGSCYPQVRDHHALEALCSGEANRLRSGFDRLRREYPVREELSGLTLRGSVNARFRPLLDALGVAYFR